MDSDSSFVLGLGPLPPSLQRLRAQLGEALWSCRLEDALQREQVLGSLRAGEPEALADAGMLRSTAKGWGTRFRREGLGGLLERRHGPAWRAPAPGPEEASSGRRRPSLRRALDPQSQRADSGRWTWQLLKWPGSKARVVERLAGLAPPRFNVYREPFAGSAALFYRLAPSRAFLTDANEELINVFRMTRDAPARLIRALARLENTEECFYTVRGQHPESLPEVQRAARTLFLNRTCFNGMYRVNRAGLFNVPWGRARGRGCFFQPECIWRWHQRLQSVVLDAGDFQEGCRLARRGDFVYLDPPYAATLRGGPAFSYAGGGFDQAAQEAVAERMAELDRRGCRVMVTNADCALVRRLFRGFHFTAMESRRQVGGQAGKRAFHAELVVRNYR